MDYSIQISTQEDTIKNYDIDSAQQLAFPYDEKVSVNQDMTVLLKEFRHPERIPDRHPVEKDFESQWQVSRQSIEIAPKHSVYKDSQHPITDLTLTLFITNPSKNALTFLVWISIIVRVYLTVYFLCVMGVTTDSEISKWSFLAPWMVAVIGSRVLYVLLVIKFGLSSPQNHLERTLKQIWSPQLIRVNQAFEYVSVEKFMTCLKNGLIPPQLSMLYIPPRNRKRVLIYFSINFIYMSIESVIMYPFAIFYNTYTIMTQDSTTGFWRYTWTAQGLACGWSLIFLGFCCYLLRKGCQLKYQKIK